MAPLLAMARIGLLGGDRRRRPLGAGAGAWPIPSALTAAQLATAAGLAEMLAQPARAQALRLRYARLEMRARRRPGHRDRRRPRPRPPRSPANGRDTRAAAPPAQPIAGTRVAPPPSRRASAPERAGVAGDRRRPR